MKNHKSVIELLDSLDEIIYSNIETLKRSQGPLIALDLEGFGFYMGSNFTETNAIHRGLRLYSEYKATVATFTGYSAVALDYVLNVPLSPPTIFEPDERDDLEVFDFMLDHGADPNGSIYEAEETITPWTNFLTKLYHRGVSTKTYEKEHFVNVAVLLLEYGADTSLKIDVSRRPMSGRSDFFKTFKTPAEIFKYVGLDTPKLMLALP